jgi:hypothetical protein
VRRIARVVPFDRERGSLGDGGRRRALDRGATSQAEGAVMRWRSIAALLALSLGACDDSEPSLYDPIYDPNDVTPVPEVELCPILAQNGCAAIRDCCEPSPYAFDEVKCRAVVRAQCEALRSRSHDQSLVYDDALAGRCAEGISALVDPSCASVDPSSDPRTYAVDHACRSMWHAGTPIGQSCIDAKSCVQIDGPPIVCASNGSARVCTEERFLYGGDSCDVFTDPTCAGGTCACAPWLICGGSSPTRPVCSDPRIAIVGTNCAFDGDCGGNLRCICADGTTACLQRTCQELPITGETCWTASDGKSARCRLGYRCDHDKNQCVDGKPLGATCGDDTECATGRCVSVCIPSGIVDPLTCTGLPDSTAFGPFNFLAPASTATGGTPPGPK